MSVEFPDPNDELVIGPHEFDDDVISGERLADSQNDGLYDELEKCQNLDDMIALFRNRTNIVDDAGKIYPCAFLAGEISIIKHLLTKPVSAERDQQIDEIYRRLPNVYGLQDTLTGFLNQVES